MWTVPPYPMRDVGKFAPAAEMDRACAIAFLSLARSILVEKTAKFDVRKDRGAVHVRREVAARKRLGADKGAVA